MGAAWIACIEQFSWPYSAFSGCGVRGLEGKVAADLCVRKGFRGGPRLDIHGMLQLFDSDHVRERDKALLQGVLIGGVWNGFFWRR